MMDMKLSLSQARKRNYMSKQDMIEVQAVVTECLPNTMFKVKLENGVVILATVSAEPVLRLLSS